MGRAGNIASNSLAVISTRRLLGERMTMKHLPDIRRMHLDEGFMRFLGGTRSERQTVTYIERNVRHWNDHGPGIWILRDADTGEIVGRGGLRFVDIDGVDEVEVGYSFFPDAWGHGLATEIATRCVQLARDVLRVPSVVALGMPEHDASHRVMQKVGMTFERKLVREGIRQVLYRKTFQPSPGDDAVD